MFKDLEIGKTHHYGDNCGEPAHNNSMNIEHKIQQEVFTFCKYFDFGPNSEQAREMVASLKAIAQEAIKQERERILSELPDRIVATSEGAKYREGYNDCLEEFKQIISKP